jgi:F-type H+-transporting ATPase subunit a
MNRVDLKKVVGFSWILGPRRCRILAIILFCRVAGIVFARPILPCFVGWKVRYTNVLGLFSLLYSPVALASSGVPTKVNFWYFILESAGFSSHTVHLWGPTLGAFFGFLVILTVGLLYRSRQEKASGDLLPDRRFSVVSLIDMIMDLVVTTGEDQIGHHAKPFMPLLAGIFVFVFFTSLAGLVPGFSPATESMNTNLAMGILVFVIYNFAGFKEHGIHYLKQFAGPVIFIAPLFFCIELVSHSVRPFSLALRLLLNIFSDHLVAGVFSGIAVVGWFVPGLMTFFGLLVVLIQSYIFTLLTAIYIAMAMSHDH